VDPSGKLGWTQNYISEGSNNRTEDHIIEVLTDQVSDAYLAHLKNLGISYIFGGIERLDFSVVVGKLKQLFSIDELMLEGGGALNGSFLNEDLIDELSLVLVPFADGASDSVTLFETNASLKNKQTGNFSLKSVERLNDDGLWMKYVTKRD
jgi:riboflavin biosynthesis pyrimidine reductase